MNATTQIPVTAKTSTPVLSDSGRQQAEQMELIGRLALGIAHDFNNLLTGVLLYCDVLLAELEPGHRHRRAVEGIRAAGEQGAALTRQLLAGARKQPTEAFPVSVNEIVISTEAVIRRLIPEQIELVFALDATVNGALVLADPVNLRQVLMNLVINARDAIGASGTIHVRTSVKSLDEAVNNGMAAHTSYVVLAVEDSGCGMSGETRARMFEPFFTTKPVGQGTGMGLATVQRIVKEIGGQIQIASEPGCGTRIEVFLPRCRTESSHALTARPAGPSSQTTESSAKTGESKC